MCLAKWSGETKTPVIEPNDEWYGELKNESGTAWDSAMTRTVGLSATHLPMSNAWHLTVVWTSTASDLFHGGERSAMVRSL